MFIKEYRIDQNELIHPFGRLVYRKVTPIEGKYDNGFKVPGRCFLYEDYVSTMEQPESFHHIVHLEIQEQYRGNGYAKLLVNQFFNKAKPVSVILEAGITHEDLYDKLCEMNCLYKYLEEHIKPFWEKFGFVDVNHTAICAQEKIPMIWPRERAQKILALGNTKLFE